MFFYFSGMESQIRFEHFQSKDLNALVHYLQQLSSATRQRFGPHPFDVAAIEAFYANPFEVIGYIAKMEKLPQIIAYSTIKLGFLEHDQTRLEAYGLQLHPCTDCTFAPSVADAWQGRGIGVGLFNFIKNDLQNRGIRRIILWGGVQQSNLPALRFYEKMGFQVLGAFEYQGENYDMVLEW